MRCVRAGLVTTTFWQFQKRQSYLPVMSVAVLATHCHV
jgi:hypothetical protein